MDITPLHRALAGLSTTAQALRAMLVAAIAARTTAALPRRLRVNPAAAASRVAATMEWLAALARTLAGDRFFLPPPNYNFPRLSCRYPSLTNDIRISCGLLPNPPSTQAQSAARRLRHIRKVFSTQPTGVIAARLARRLGLTPADDAWPADLVAITQTPAECQRRPAKAPPREPAPAQCPLPEPQTDPDPTEHKRE